MKISNNALNFLLAQYRAIFKRAYVKGIASAVLLTAGLAAGQAQAAAIYLNGTPNELPTTGQIANITGNSTDPSGAYDPETGDGEFTYLNINSGDALELNGEVIIKSGAAQANASSNRILGTNEIGITGEGRLTIAIDSNGNPATDGLLVISNGETVSVNIDTIDVQKGLLEIRDSSTSSGDATVGADTITIGSGNGSAKVALIASSTNKTVTLGNAVSSDESGSDITVSENGVLNLQGTGASGTQVVGKSLTIGANGVMLTDAGAANKVSTSNLTVETDGFKVITTDTTKETFAGHTAEIAGNLLIGSGASWVVAATNDPATDDVIEGTTTFKSGSNTQIGGTLTVSGGKLTVETGAGLFATEASAGSSKAGTIEVTKNGTDSGTLVISSADLKDFLNAKDTSGNAITYSEIKTNDDDKYIVDTETDPAPEADKGSILLSGGILELSDINRIDLADGFSFSGGATNGKAGMILVGSSDGGTVKGHDLMISKALSGGIDATKELTVEADILTIGGSLTSNTETKLSDFKVKNFKAHDEVILDANDGSNEFTIDQTLTLERDFYNKNTDGSYNTSSLKGVGTIKGDNLILSGSSAKAPLTINGGAWENEGQSLTIQSGTLTVGAVSGDTTQADGEDTNGTWKYTKNGNPASLTWHGDFIFDGDSQASDAEVKVIGASGADATLDLTDAAITWGSGSITLSGDIPSGKDDPVQVSPTDYFARAGQGILKLTDNQMAEYLGLSSTNATINTKMTAEKGGLILVEGGINQEINVNKFENKATASATAGAINLSGGMMFVTGDLDLVTGVEANATKPTFGQPTDLADDIDPLTFNGVLGAHNITLNNESKLIDEDAQDTNDDKVTVSGGTLAVASSFSSDNHVVEFISGAGLLLDTNGFLAQYDASTIGESGTVNVDKLVFNGAAAGGTPVSKLDVQTGAWTIGSSNDLGDIDLQAGAVLNVGPGGEEFIRTGVGASLTADNLGVAANATASKITIDQGGNAKFNTVQAEGATIEVADDSTFEITGILNSGDFVTKNGTTTVSDNAPATLDAIGDYDQIVAQAGIALSGANITVKGGTFVLGDAAARKLITLDASSGDNIDAVKINTGLDGAKFTLSDGGVLRLDFKAAEGDDKTVGLAGVNGGKALTAKQAAELKKELIEDNGGKINLGSYINVGDLALGMNYNSTNMTAEWADVKDFIKIESDVTNDDLVQLLILNAEDGLAGQFGAVSTTKNTTEVEGSLGLHQARAFEGSTEKFFASQVVNGERVAAGLSVKDDSTLALYGEGTIGTLTGAGTSSDSTVLFKAGDLQAGETVVKPINKNSYAISDMGRIVADNAVRVEGKAEAGAIEVGQSFTAESLELYGANGTSTVFGTLDTKNLTLSTTGASSTNQLLVAGGTVRAVETTLASGVTLKVGQDASTKVQNNPDTTIDETASYSGIFETTRLALHDGLLIVDPEYDQPTALASIRNFADAKDADYTDKSQVGTADGSIFVGQNSALGIGTESAAELAQVIAKYQTNGHLSDAADRLGAIVYLDGIVSIENNKGLVMTNQSLDNFVEYIKNDTKLNSAITTAAPTIANSIYFGDGTALMATADAIKAAGKQNQALVTLETTDGKLVADGGEVIISGDLRANPDHQYKLFADQGTGTNGDWVKVVDTEGKDVAAGAGIDVTTENGFLTGHIDNTNGGTISLSVNKAQAYSIMNGASDPVVQTLIAYAQGYNSEIRDENGNVTDYDYLHDGYTYDQATGEVTGLNRDYSNKFLAASIEQGNGAAAEAVARLGVYGGAPQAAIKAGQSSTDAIAARFGIGSAISNLTVAGNTQGAALWLAPVYKTSDSDGFDAQGVDYGVNVDLYGVALGADYTLANGMSFGAMFNVGSGEVDGEGAASPVTNDFDYYGFGAYAGYTMGQFSVVGDISYTVADNEVEASTSVDHIGAQMDSTNLSLGVTGKYELNFNGVNVTPHVGLRYSNIDLDDYTIDGEDVIASADSDKLNLFSIPVGVTIAKEFKGESWTVAPSFDLTLTGQFGDDELDGSVSWAGVSNLTTDTTTEVFDNFTYGATLGVEAQSVGGVALGINVGYTGSSNVDEFGVNANARFTF